LLVPWRAEDLRGLWLLSAPLFLPGNLSFNFCLGLVDCSSKIDQLANNPRDAYSVLHTSCTISGRCYIVQTIPDRVHSNITVHIDGRGIIRLIITGVC
jgi:hypothetical protein